MSRVVTNASEAITLALEIDATRLLLDERPARRQAQALGLPVVGTLGILLAAKRKSLLAEIRPCLKSLVDHQFRISEILLERILRDAGEVG